MKPRNGFVNVELPVLRTGGEVESVHEAGADQFGGKWLLANQAAVNAAQGLGVAYHTPEMKQFMGRVVLRVLQATVPRKT